jgi:hypothetical protein
MESCQFCSHNGQAGSNVENTPDIRIADVHISLRFHRRQRFPLALGDAKQQVRVGKKY